MKAETGSAAKRINWPLIRLDYVTSLLSWADLARKYGIDQGNARRRGRREGWEEARKAYREETFRQCERRMSEFTAAKTAGLLSGYAEELKRDIVRMSRRLVEKIDETMGYDEPFSPRDLKSFSSMLSDLLVNRERMAGADRKEEEDNRLVVEFVDRNGEDDEA